jgi:hypothetical protein
MKDSAQTRRTEKEAAGRKKARAAEERVLRCFISIFCRQKHGPARSAASAGHAGPAALCTECADLLRYALRKLSLCPYDPKPKCKDCPTHCYRKDYRRRIREVMRFSGIYFVKRGRLDWLLRYFLMGRNQADPHRLRRGHPESSGQIN